jgi:hypothetical protein
MLEGNLKDVRDAERKHRKEIEREVALSFKPQESKFNAKQFEDQWRVTADLNAKYLCSQGLLSKFVAGAIPYVVVFVPINVTNVAKLAASRNQVVAEFTDEEYRLIVITPVSNSLVSPKKND